MPTILPSMNGDGTRLLEPTNPSDYRPPNYESLDYDVCENQYHMREEKKRENAKYFSLSRDFNRWLIIFMTGILTALTACFIVITIDQISHLKYSLLQHLIDQCPVRGCYVLAFFAWLSLNAFPIAIGSAIVTYGAPVAAGSGIPVIKCYLNGVKVDEVVRIKTFFTKAFGVICSVVGGLACGKEGPMIHCGAVIAAGISQGKSTTFNALNFDIFHFFRNDKEKRDFVSAGAAAGVAAAFGAPVGGVLFSLEEGASFWNQALTWRIFFCSMVSTFTLNLILSLYQKRALSSMGLINFGKFPDVEYSLYEFPVYILMGAIGGALGALFDSLNKQLSLFRRNYIRQRCLKVLEAVAVAIITASVGFLSILYSDDCREIQNRTSIDYPIRFQCPEGHYSVMGSLWFNTPEHTVNHLLQDEHAVWSTSTLVLFFCFYFLLACLTYGLSISGGVFIPALLVGACWGRLFAQLISMADDDMSRERLIKYALLGAAATLGGVVRMTISLTVILMEACGSISFGLPIMITLMTAKWVGDYLFKESLYDTAIHLAQVPFVPWEPPKFCATSNASAFMTTPVVTLRSIECLSRMIEVLENTPHNGFPIVDNDQDSGDLEKETQLPHHGRFKGLILRWQLIVLLQKRVFSESGDFLGGIPEEVLNFHSFLDAYPRYPRIEEVSSSITAYDREHCLIDLRPVMNPGAYCIRSCASFNKVFVLFRALGLRHLVVVNDENKIVGIITRKDIVKFLKARKGEDFYWSVSESTNLGRYAD